MTAYRKCTERFLATEVDDELILLDMEGGELLSLEGSARAIWGAIDGRRGEAEIAAEAAAGFAGDAQAMEREVRDFLGELTAAGLVRKEGRA
ncbi:PqqD family protein [Qipengyuania atrilutea]|uniref:PqqD family protein n=1 Tax=Qipengyuania atrilutea TaxID=2744473 RepID=A0A850H3T7_9SPHN|nr:PqqD family protein [Actirhodobacter atriluteus]NVD44558.1 PqqD family protein [Actirhodobacter atriluteus]